MHLIRPQNFANSGLEPLRQQLARLERGLAEATRKLEERQKSEVELSADLTAKDKIIAELTAKNNLARIEPGTENSAQTEKVEADAALKAKFDALGSINNALRAENKAMAEKLKAALEKVEAANEEISRLRAMENVKPVVNVAPTKQTSLGSPTLVITRETEKKFPGEKILAIFDAADVSKSGSLTKDDAVSLALQVLESPVPRVILSRVFRAVSDGEDFLLRDQAEVFIRQVLQVSRKS